MYIGKEKIILKFNINDKKYNKYNEYIKYYINKSK
jgi:hypothetical protein